MNWKRVFLNAGLIQIIIGVIGSIVVTIRNWDVVGCYLIAAVTIARLKKGSWIIILSLFCSCSHRIHQTKPNWHGFTFTFLVGYETEKQIFKK